MNENGGERVRPMLNPPNLGELIRENMEEVGWSDKRAAAHGVRRNPSGLHPALRHRTPMRGGIT